MSYHMRISGCAGGKEREAAGVVVAIRARARRKGQYPRCFVVRLQSYHVFSFQR